MTFGGITHVIPNPKGHAPGYVYSLVGSVPIGCMDARIPTRSDIMGGRVIDGKAYTGKRITTIEDAVTIIRAGNGKLCSNPSCSCWKMLTGAGYRYSPDRGWIADRS